MLALLILLTVLFALNMGGSTFAASFAASYGGKVLSKRNSQILFLIFVTLGALLIGQPVANTLGKGIVPQELLSPVTVLIIVGTATISLFASNLFHVPQSTSFVTVFAIMGVGAFHKAVNKETFFFLIPMWLLFPLLGFFITYFLGKFAYPPRKGNLWFYEKFVNHKGRLGFFVNVTSCYNAFSVGANNVANAVGPLLGAGILTGNKAFLILAPIFGLGAFIFHKPLEETSKKIIPIGMFSAFLMAIVGGTLMLIASLLGVPQSFVMLNLSCLFAVGSLKASPHETFSNPVTKRTYWMWIIMPIITFILSFLLTTIYYEFLN